MTQHSLRDLTWVVLEDLAGVLSLFVFAGDSDTVIFGRVGYETSPGALRGALVLLYEGHGAADLPGGLPDAQARWDALGEAGADRGGYCVIADEEETVPAEAMGTAAWAELTSRGARYRD